MKTGIALGVALGLFAAQTAGAQSIDSNPAGPYLGVTMGLHFYDDDDDADLDFGTGASIGAQLGYRFNNNVRAELQGEVTGAEIDDSDDEELILGRATVGLYYDFRGSNQGFVPYVGGGIGIAAGTLGGFSDEIEEDVDIEGVLTWHAEGGIVFNLSPHIATVPSYRYTRTDSDDDDLDDFTSHAVRVGLMISF